MPAYDNYELNQVLQRELEADERLLWSGRPSPVRAMGQTLPVVLFAIPWTAFAIFWEWNALSIGSRSPQGFGIAFPLFGIPFILIGLGMFASPLWAYLTAQRTIHAVTDRRVFSVVQGWTRKVTTYVPRDMKNIERREKPDGSGDVVFGRRQVSSNSGSKMQEIGLFGVQDVRLVESLIRQYLLENENPEALSGYRVSDSRSERI